MGNGDYSQTDAPNDQIFDDQIFADRMLADRFFDILRGVAALTGSALVADLARLVGDGIPPELEVAFNHKQIASKRWLRNTLFDAWGGEYDRVLVVGGWYGVLSAMLLDDPRFQIRLAESLDIDAACAPVATSLNRRHVAAGRFRATTGDMTNARYGGGAPASVTINTSCEHILDLRGWLARLGPGARVALQSNDYRREPDHVSCVSTIEEFVTQAGLASVAFRGALPTKNYTRFMLLGFT